MKTDLSTARRVYFALGATLALTILVTGALLIGNFKLTEADDLVSGGFRVDVSLQHLNTLLTEAESNQRAYLLTGDETYLRLYNQAPARIQAELDLMRALIVSEAQKRRLAGLRPLVEQRVASLERLLEISRNQGRPAAIRELSGGADQQAMSQVKTFIDEMKAERKLLLEDRENQEVVARQTTFLVILGGGILFLFITALVVIWFVLENAVRIRVERRLHISDSQSRLMANAVPVQISYVDRNEVVRFCNEQVARWYGLPVNEIINRPLSEILDREAYRASRPYFIQALAGEEVSYEQTRQGGDGRLRHFKLTYLPYLDEDGQPHGFYSLAQDITELKEKVEELGRSQVAYRTLVGNFPNGNVMLFDRDMRYVLTGGRSVLIDDKQPEGAEGKTLQEALPPDMVEFMEPLYRQALAGESVAVEYSRDGRTAALRLVPVRNEQGEIYGGLSMVQNITAQKQTEQALRESEEAYRTLAYNFPNGNVFLFDQELRLLVVGGTSLDNLAGEAPKLEGKMVGEALPERVLQQILPYYRAALAGETHQFEYINQDKVWLAHVLPVRKASGEIYAGLSMTQDVTEARRAADAVQRLNLELEIKVRQRTRQLEATVKELEAFSYSVSHDLRSPLRAIDGFSRALLEDYWDQLDDEGKDYLNRVRSASQRMARLIDDILGLSRLSRREMHFDTVDLSRLAAEVTAELKEAQPERAADIIIEPGLLAEADASLIRIALANLLGNAWKYTRQALPARIEFGQQLNEDGRVYFVRDNGVGFSMEYAHKLFKPFQRLHTEVEFEGTGIGLATVQRILNRHGGRIWVNSEPGRGTTFYFTLGGPPAARPRVEQPAALVSSENI